MVAGNAKRQMQQCSQPLESQEKDPVAAKPSNKVHSVPCVLKRELCSSESFVLTTTRQSAVKPTEKGYLGSSGLLLLAKDVQWSCIPRGHIIQLRY